MGRAFAPRIDHLDIVRIAGSGCWHLDRVATAPASGLAIVSPALDAGQCGATFSRRAPAVRAQAGANTAAPRSASIFLRPSPRFRTDLPTVGDDGPPVASSGMNLPGFKGDPGGVFDSMGSGTPPAMPARPITIARPVSISHMSEGDLVHKILPTYPPLARVARLQGQVVLQAVISRQGAIENLGVLAGHPMLVPAAIEAVRQWRYRPYILNGEPVEVETQITVNFSLMEN